MGKAKTKTKSKPKRRYTDEQRAQVVAAVKANGDVKNTAGKFGIPSTTVDYWVKEGSEIVNPKLREKKKRELADEFEAIAYELIGATRGKISAIHPKDAMVSAGIAVDKMRLLREQPTSVTNDLGLEFVGRLAAVILSRQSQPVASGGIDGEPAALVAVDAVSGSASASVPDQS